MILDGKKIAAETYEKLKIQISELKEKPTLWVILVWENPASLKYIAQKKKWAEYIGMWFELCQMDVDISEENLIQKIIVITILSRELHSGNQQDFSSKNSEPTQWIC